MKKYKLLKKEENGLWRIVALKDFGKDFDEVKKGSKGGIISSEDNLSQEGTCWVHEYARVSGNAQVCQEARIYGQAEVFGQARIFGEARIFGQAWVFKQARIYGKAEVCEQARIYGKAEVCGQAQIYGEARIYGQSYVYGKSQIYGNILVCDNAQVYGKARVSMGMLTKDIFADVKKYIACSFGVYPVNGKYLLYKRVNKIKDGEWASMYDSNFVYRKGEYAFVKDYDPDINISCKEGIHVSTPFYWDNDLDRDDTLIAVEVKVEDVITCQEGKLRVKGVTPIEEINQ